MTPLAALFIALVSIGIFVFPRKWAAVLLLLGVTYLPMGISVEAGPFHFTVIRILVAVGAMRAIARGEFLHGGWNTLDKVMVAFAIAAIASTPYHNDFSSALVFRAGFAYDILGIYFLFRCFLRTFENVEFLGKSLLILLIPIAVEMIAETRSQSNTFSMFGGIADYCAVRGGKVRAQGPFGHSILAGSVGAFCLPLCFLFWKRHRVLALVGLTTVGIIIRTSHSSGPIMTAAFVIIGMLFWIMKDSMRSVRIAFVMGLVVLHFAMNAPIYYLLARINLTGESASWHRAALIESAIKNINEWWLGGTDYTRHWMTNPLYGSTTNVDITNHYVKMGVIGGLPLLIIFVAAITVGFSFVGQMLTAHKNTRFEQQFLIWAMGATLFGHAATMLSVSYFDQSFVYLFLTLAIIGSLQNIRAANPARRHSPNEGTFRNHC